LVLAVKLKRQQLKKGLTASLQEPGKAGAVGLQPVDTLTPLPLRAICPILYASFPSQKGCQPVSDRFIFGGQRDTSRRAWPGDS